MGYQFWNTYMVNLLLWVLWNYWLSPNYIILLTYDVKIIEPFYDKFLLLFGFKIVKKLLSTWTDRINYYANRSGWSRI